MSIMNRHAAFVLAISLLAAFSACKQYTVDAVLDEDGSGTRTLELSSVTLSEDDFEITLDDFQSLFSLEAERGWTMKKEVTENEDGVTLESYLFTLEHGAKDVASWRKMSGDLSIKGTLEKGPYEDIALRNEIEVTVTDGKIYTYREILTWNGLKEKIVDFQANFFRESIAAEYPFLAEHELDALETFFSGVLIVAWYVEAVADNAVGDEIYASAVGDYAERFIRSGHPDEDLSQMREVIEHTIDGRSEDALDAFIMETLPGAYLAGQTSLTFRITMPGEITETNAPRVEGRTAIWEQNIMLEPFNRPVELFVRSERPE